jgi:hypothetical protein
MSTDQLARPASVDLYWLPLGAGDNTHCVRTNGLLFEWATARYQHRDRFAGPMVPRRAAVPGSPVTWRPEARRRARTTGLLTGQP